MAMADKEVEARMGMKLKEIVDWYDVEDGVLVVTKEGAQTLLLPEGGHVPVVPPRPVPTKSSRPAIKVEATVGAKKAS